MDYKEINNLIDKYLDGESSLEEEQYLRTFFADNKNVPKHLKHFTSMFNGFNQAKKIKYYAPKKHLKKYIYIAASVAVLIGVSVGIYQATPKVHKVYEKNYTQEPKKVNISSLDAIWLNTNADVSFVKSKKMTIISVNGEVYFEFSDKKNNNRQVLAHNVAIKVETSAKFNIKMSESDDNINIYVKSGAIKVMDGALGNGFELLVVEGNYCSVHKTKHLILSSAIENPNYLAWKNKELIFENTPIATVTDVLSEFYKVDFDVADKAVAYCQFTGKFKNEPIDNVLKQIEINTLCRVSNKNGVFSIHGKSCLN